VIDALGLDLSLTATGYASAKATGVFKVRTTGMRRLAEIRETMLDLALDVDVVAIEEYAFSRADAYAHELGELGGIVRLTLWQRRIPYVDIPPASLKRFATGKGNASKDEVLAAAIRRFEFEGSNNNEADAWILRQMALAFYGQEGAWDRGNGPTTAMADALAKVSWPLLDVQGGEGVTTEEHPGPESRSGSSANGLARAGELRAART
jgi:crossover junction endodeoxyribonuclease RuvC